MAARMAIAFALCLVMAGGCWSGVQAGEQKQEESFLVQLLGSNFTMFMNLLEEADLLGDVESDEIFVGVTIFAPTNEYLTERVSPSLLSFLEEPSNDKLLREVLLNHIVRGKLTSESWKAGETLKTFADGDAKLYIEGGKLKVNDAVVKEVGVLKAEDGVVHSINGFLVPEKLEEYAHAYLKEMAEKASKRRELEVVTPRVLAAPAPTPSFSLFPYGPGAGDAKLFFCDDCYASPVALPSPMSFFSTKFTTFGVSNNGYFGFPSVGSQYYLSGPTPSFSYIAPFQYDVDTTSQSSGGVYYRTVSPTNKPGDLSLLAQEVKTLFPSDPEAQNFRPDGGLVVSYINIGYYPRKTDLKNTFQAWVVWSSSGYSPQTYTCFLYPKGGIQRASANVVGYFTSNQEAGLNLLSSTRISNLPLESNVNVPGKWCFKLSTTSSLFPWLSLSASGGFLMQPTWSHTALMADANEVDIRLSEDFHTCDGRLDQYERFPGTDSAGFDESTSAVTSVVECQRLCTADCDCVGFVVSAPTAAGGTLACATKAALRAAGDRASDPGKALYVRKSGTSSNTRGLWVLQLAETRGYVFKQAQGNKCFQLSPDLPSGPLLLSDCHYGPNQTFVARNIRSSDSAVQWENVESGLCLSSENAYPGTPLQQYNCGNFTSRQYWQPLNVSSFRKLPLSTPASFSFSSFQSTSGVIRQYSAELLTGRLRLTYNWKYLTGVAFYESPIELLQYDANGACQAASFTTKFSFRLSAGNVSGADGITFVLLTPNAVLSYFGRKTGGNLAYSYNLTAGSVGSTAISFDTWPNPLLGEPAIIPNVGIRENLNRRVIKTETTNILGNYSGVKFAWVEYDGALGSWSVYLNDGDLKPSQPLLTHSAALCNILQPAGCGAACKDLNTAFIGFTASTGGASEAQDILTWDFQSSWPVPGP